MEFITDYRLEQYILNTKWDDFPEEIKTRALMNSLDLLTALVLGSKGAQCKAGTKLAEAYGMLGNTPVIGSSKCFNLLGAAITMGHASNSFDIDDGHNMIKGHPGTSFIGGLMAAALDRNVSYTEYLTTLIICYEVTIRWAFSMQDHYHYLHSTGTYGAFGTAAGVGRILGLSKEQLNNALSIADFHAPLTPVMRAVEYPSMNKDGVPFGALTGTMAVLETICGTTGKTHLLELAEYSKHLDSLGKKYYCTDLYYKPYTCCRWAHQPILAIQNLLKEHTFTHHDVKCLTVHTFEAAAKLSKIEPKDTDEAQYNIAFPVACSLVFGDVGYHQVCDAAVHNPEVLHVMKLLKFVVDPDMERRFPAERLAWVEIELKDGQLLKSDVYCAPGEHSDPNLSLEWIIEKFKRITAPLLNKHAQEEIVRAFTTFSDIPMRDLISIVNEQMKKT